MAKRRRRSKKRKTSAASNPARRRRSRPAANPYRMRGTKRSSRRRSIKKNPISTLLIDVLAGAGGGAIASWGAVALTKKGVEKYTADVAKDSAAKIPWNADPRKSHAVVGLAALALGIGAEMMLGKDTQEIGRSFTAGALAASVGGLVAAQMRKADEEKAIKAGVAPPPGAIWPAVKGYYRMRQVDGYWGVDPRMIDRDMADVPNNNALPRRLQKV